MMNRILAASLLMASSQPAFALNPAEQKQVEHIIQLFKQNNAQAIAQSIQYPLNREAPLPAIQNAKEMQQRFAQVFDAQLKQDIAQSKFSQWDAVGWRGIMLDSGKVWMSEGKITAVNYSSPAEQQLKKQLIAQQKQSLHPSLRSFKAPVFSFATQSFAVRIDELPNGQYRYASWKAGQAQSAKPALVLNKGTVQFDGSGGNHHYDFKSGSYSYTVERNIMGASETPEVNLTVKQAGKVILNQAGSLLTNAK